jgi:hypothetical protein
MRPSTSARREKIASARARARSVSGARSIVERIAFQACSCSWVVGVLVGR